VLVHHTRLRRYFERRGLARSDAEDLIQDAYLRLLTLTERQRPEKTANFLMITARNLLVDFLRRDRGFAFDLLENVDSLGPHDSLGPDRHLEALEASAGFNAAIRLLPPQRRQVYWLRRVHQFSIKETARHLRISENTVEQHLRVALACLKSSGIDAPGRRTYRPSRRVA
jgi:RNA polymerase sigma-70 factor (ECF subfamily)